MDQSGIKHKTNTRLKKPIDKFKIPDTGKNNNKIDRKKPGNRDVIETN